MALTNARILTDNNKFPTEVLTILILPLNFRKWFQPQIAHFGRAFSEKTKNSSKFSAEWSCPCPSLRRRHFCLIRSTAIQQTIAIESGRKVTSSSPDWILNYGHHDK